MNIARFEKVSKNRFLKDLSALGIRDAMDHEDILLPQRATSGSAGYDFYAPEDVLIQKGIGGLIRTGIKVHMPEDEHLEIHIRSSYGMKYGMRLANGVGIIDADYYNNEDNEGHIMLAFHNHGDKPVLVEKGMRVAQGIFYSYLTVDGDEAGHGEKRRGGMGSTGAL